MTDKQREDKLLQIELQVKRAIEKRRAAILKISKEFR